MTKVLIVDDEVSLRITLSKFLFNEGYEVLSASNADEAYQEAQRFNPDVVVSDIVMPKGSGIELMMKLRKQSSDLQIIIMTGEPTVETAVSAVQNGASDYISKPIHKDDFLNIVRKAAEIKKLLDQKRELESRNQEYQRDLERMVERRTFALQHSMESIILLLSQVVESRDPYTAGHQRRVGNLAAVIAQKMNMSKQKAEEIRTIGYIHDIGKISIPAEILSKPGKLTDLEMALLRNHSFSGYELLKGSNLPETVAETIYQHHERCDGSGYPRQLIESEILMESHILIVADVVEAMMSHRPYRPSLGKEAALSEIQNRKGIAYRSDVVDACLQVFNEDKYEIDDLVHSISLSF